MQCLDATPFSPPIRAIGGTRTFTYNTSTGLLTSVTDFKGVAEYRGYDANRDLSAVIDRRGYTTNFTHNAVTGGVTQVQYPLTPPDATPSTVQTVFGSAGCPDANNQDANNPYYPYSVTNELGKTTTFLRDANKRVIQINYPDGGFETFAYNGFGQVISHRMTNGYTETFEYDATGRLTVYRSPLQQSGTPTLRYQYDVRGRISGVSDIRAAQPGGAYYTTNYEYNDRGLVTRLIRPWDIPTGQRFTVTSVYNPDGTAASVTDELNHTTSYAYDDYKRVTSVTNALNQTASFVYAFDWVDSTVHTTSNPKAIFQPGGEHAEFAYDENWRPTIQVAAAGTAEAAAT